MFNKAVLVFKAYRNLEPPYFKQLFICSNTRTTSRFINLPKPRKELLKTSFSFPGSSLRNTVPTQIRSCNSLTSFKIQLHKWSRNRFLKKSKKISFLVFNVYIHARIVSQCYYVLIYYSFVLFIMICRFTLIFPPMFIYTVLQGDPNISNNTNSLIFEAVLEFIAQSGRFAIWNDS